MFNNLVLSIIDLINKCVPKDNNRIIFYSFPDYSDNARAIYEELLKHKEIKQYKITWVVKNTKKYKNIITVGNVVKHKSIISLIYYVKSKYIIRTHSFFGNRYFQGKQIMCVAWHGMLIKGYHYSEKNIYKRNGHDYFCVTSKLFQELFSEMFNSDIDRFNITGLPRNDYLFKDAKELLKILKIDKYKKRIIWMPTFRAYKNGTDGKENASGLPTISTNDLELINNVLIEKDYCLILKLHPWSFNKAKEYNYSNIINIKEEDIPETYTLYHLLGQMDAMISDYSSVWCDFLLLNRPIAFAFDDLEEYKKSRYMPLSPIENFMPGVKTKNVYDLIEFIYSLDKEDKFKEERKRIRNMFLLNCDDRSSERFIKEIGLIK